MSLLHTKGNRVTLLYKVKMLNAIKLIKIVFFMHGVMLQHGH